MTEEEFTEFLNTSPEKLCNLQQLDFTNNNIPHLNRTKFKTFCINLSHCNNIRILNLSANYLYKLDRFKVRTLCIIISTLSHLQQLDLSHNYLGYTDNTNLQAFYGALLGFSGLLQFELEQHQINLLNILQYTELRIIKEHCKKLQAVIIRTTYPNDLTKVKTIAICNALKNFPNLEKIELLIPAMYNLNEARFIEIFNILSVNKDLQLLHLNLYFLDELNDFKFKVLCDALISHVDNNKVLSMFELNYNNVTDQAFSSVQMANRLQIINLNNNHLNKLNLDTLKLLCTTLSNCPNLKLISISNNYFNIITKLQIQYLAITIKKEDQTFLKKSENKLVLSCSVGKNINAPLTK